MNKYDLFCLIFYALDAVWDDNHDTELGNFLSAANPFLFTDHESADPAIYDDFASKVPNIISIDESYQIAKKYIFTLNSEKINKAFDSIHLDEWMNSVTDYLSSHDGANNSTTS